MSLYFSSAVDIAVLTMGENPKDVQPTLSTNPPRGALSTDHLQVSTSSCSRLLGHHRGVLSPRPRSPAFLTAGPGLI